MPTTGTVWDQPPPNDEAGAVVSSMVDRQLMEDRKDSLRRGVRTLLLSPDEKRDDAFRLKLLDGLGQKAWLVEPGKISSSGGDPPEPWAELTTLRFNKESTHKLRKVMGSLEPALLLYAMDPGSGEDARKAVKRTMAHFLFAIKTLGVESGCAVVVVVNNADGLAQRVVQDVENFQRLLPTLPGDPAAVTPGGAIKALKTEFGAAAHAAGRPRDFRFAAVHDNQDPVKVAREALESARAALEESIVMMPSLALNKEVITPALSGDNAQPRPDASSSSPSPASTPSGAAVRSAHDYAAVSVALVSTSLALGVVALAWPRLRAGGVKWWGRA